ncbi:MAG: hypothetical protein MSA54_00030 [Campylobacter sp.]|uniref:hypothetical protein n=1 Tax=Campylobacter sp. TaxID=205 RepID=UPI002AA72070|nr:hypothetical protein [Campylobacter sp.]MCI7500326.1 hypothetical protein [Campylobacter sp.]
MQGKILSTQLIIGDDGKRYEYDKNDVINLDGKDLALLTGSQVEFLSFDNRVAKSIYIIAENLNVSSILSADSISSARAKALWGLGLIFFSFLLDIELLLYINFTIPYIWEIIAIVGFVLYSMAIYSVKKAAASKNLFKNYIIATIISFLDVSLFFMLAPSNASSASNLNTLFSLCPIIALIAAIYVYKIHAELARLSGSSRFLWSFWIFVVSVPLCFLFIISLGFAGFLFIPGFGGLIMSWMLLFVAWWRFGKLEKR